MAAHTECTLGKHAAVLDVGLCAFAVQDVEQNGVFGLAWNDDHIVEVLGAGTNERDAAYIDFLDDVGLGRTAGNRLFKRIKVNNDQVDFRNLILLHLLLVALVLATTQNASEHFRMERLHAPSENRRISSHTLHGLAVVAQRLDELLGAACRKEFHALGVQLGEQFVQAVFMEHRYQCSLDFLCCSHIFFVHYIFWNCKDKKIHRIEQLFFAENFHFEVRNYHKSISIVL